MHYEFDKVKLLRVVDGDTFDFEIDLGFKVVIRERFRLKGINTPEIFRPVNESELRHGEGAARYVKGLLESAEGHIKLSSHKSGLYGRWDADIYLSGKSLADILKDAGYARLTDEEYLSDDMEEDDGLSGESTENN